MNEAGVDEAGRGPVLGPLVIAGVVLPPSEIEKLVNKGLTDSKSLSRKKREELYELILDVAIDHQIVILEPSEIDARVSQSISLNKLELMNMVKVLSSLKNWSTAYVDACDVNAERFQLILQSELQATINVCTVNEGQAHPILQNQLQTNIIAEHGADLKYPVVSAASVIAKVIRDREIEKAHKEFDFDFGSGYPCDPKTNRFLVNYYRSFGELPKIARKSWETSKRLVRFFEQSKLDEFFKADLRKKISLARKMPPRKDESNHD